MSKFTYLLYFCLLIIINNIRVSSKIKSLDDNCLAFSLIIFLNYVEWKYLKKHCIYTEYGKNNVLMN